MRFALAALALLALAQPSSAKVVKFEVLRVESPAFEGRVFGAVGTYDRVIARATIAVLPSDPHNLVIVDIGRAPRNAQGLVEAVSDVEILRPTVAANGNRRLFYDVVNRGNKIAPGLFNDHRAGNELHKADDAGTGFLMNRGYTLVWSGWQGDAATGDGRLTFTAPVVSGVTGLSREEFVFDHLQNPAPVQLSYPTADFDLAHTKLTVRAREADERTAPSGLLFQFDGPNKISIGRPVGFDAGAIYEFIYVAKDPKVLGLGFAATRDIVSYLRHPEPNELRPPDALAGTIDHAIAFGASQSGRYLHDFLYLGFNADEAGRPVFDGLMPHISGGKKMFTNFRFGQPGRQVQQHSETVYPLAQFPFTYPVITDAVTGKTDGWLRRCLADNTCPKIIQTDTELEFYQSRASLVTTDTQGNALDMPDNVRLFLLSNLQHAAPANARSEPIAICRYPSNPLFAGPPLRALLVAMDAWISDGTAPPASRYPSREDGTLIEPNAEAAIFPKIPGVAYTGLVTPATVINTDVMPPTKGAAYPVYVPKTDADGRDLAGIRLPTLEAPIATHMGWNLRNAGFAFGELCDNNGSMLPFAKTKEERLAKGDPRPSIAERYPNDGDRAQAISRAARQLVRDRLLLPEDARSFPATN